MRLTQSILIVFNRGGRQPEVVFLGGCQSFRRGFPMDSDCLRMVSGSYRKVAATMSYDVIAGNRSNTLRTGAKRSGTVSKWWRQACPAFSVQKLLEYTMYVNTERLGLMSGKLLLVEIRFNTLQTLAQNRVECCQDGRGKPPLQC